MTAGLISAIVPTTISSSGFALRRLDKACNANDAVQTTMNSVIASGQIERAAECSANIARLSTGSVANLVTSAEENIKNAVAIEKAATETSSVFKSIGKGCLKAVKFVGYYLNEFILLTSLFKVCKSDDPIKEGILEGAAVTCMLAGTEPLYKRAFGMATYERKNGKLITQPHDALIKKLPYAEKAAEAMNDYFATKKFFGKSLKQAPSVLKGIGLILASMGGYFGGRKATEYVYNSVSSAKNAA